MLVPGVVAALIWVFLTNIDFGLFNTLLRTAGLPPQTWLGAGSALQVLAALDVWRSVGYWAIFFLAALIGLPQELYQAAELDGAGAWQRFRRITLPLLRRVILFAVVVATIYGLQVFDTVLILTNGGPGHVDGHDRVPRLALRLRQHRQGRLCGGHLASRSCVAILVLTLRPAAASCGAGAARSEAIR